VIVLTYIRYPTQVLTDKSVVYTSIYVVFCMLAHISYSNGLSLGSHLSRQNLWRKPYRQLFHRMLQNATTYVHSLLHHTRQIHYLCPCFFHTLRTSSKNLLFQVLSTVIVKSSSFWVIVPCSLKKNRRRFDGTRYLPLQDWINKSIKHPVRSILYLPPFSCWLLICLNLRSWRWK
jgi:hypothetical protein